MNREQLAAELNKRSEVLTGLLSADTRDAEAIASATLEVEAISAQIRATDVATTPTTIATRDSVAVSPNAEAFRALQTGAASGAETMVSLDANVRDIFSGSPSIGGLDVVVPEFDAIIDRRPRRNLGFLDILPVRTTVSDTVVYYVQTGFSSGVTTVAKRSGSPADFAAYGQSNVSIVKRTATVQTLGTYARTSRETIADASQVQSIVEDEILYSLREKIHNLLVAATDEEGSELPSIAVTGMGRAQSRTYDISGDDNTDRLELIEAIRKAKTDARKALLPADFVALSPTAYEAIQLAKNAIGQYIAGGPFAGEEGSIWGLKMIEVDALSDDDATPVGRVIVGSTRGITFYARQGMELGYSENFNDDFVRNAAVIRGNVRCTLTNRRPECVVVVTGVSGS